MSYLDKEYIAPTGHDFTQYVRTKEDAEKFDQMAKLEEECRGVPAAECIHKVVQALNMGRELMGVKARVMIQGNPKLN